MTDLTALSLGAGVQSTTLALLAVDGTLPKPDVAIFADTGWEPKAVYAHLARLEPVLEAAGIPVHRVERGDIREDVLAGRDYINMPVFVAAKDGGAAPLTRQCTGDYKLDPIVRWLKRALGAKVSKSGAVLPPPAGSSAVQWIGFSKDEIGRVKPSRYPWITNVYPLLDLPGGADGRPGWTRADCRRHLDAAGWGETPRSACIGCPLHGNKSWRNLRDNSPEEWADAVAFDEALRTDPRVRSGAGVPYLHRSLLPLAEAPIDKVTRREWNDRQADLLDMVADDAAVRAAEEGDPDGCSPYGCRSGEEV